MRLISTLLTLGALGYGLWWVNEKHPELKDHALELLNTRTFSAFESRYTSKQILEKSNASGEAQLQFYPYLLMDVKFTNPADQTEEGTILWDLVEGEMVLDTKNWKKTHGFADCIHAKADKHEYMILSAISSIGGKADKQALSRSLNTEPTLVATWIEKCKRKKLIVQQGQNYRIHLQNPLVQVKASTFVTTPLITKAQKHREKIQRRFSPAEVKRAAEAAFGADFAIRSAHEVCLPVYSITSQNAEGVFQTTLWNGISGQKYTPPGA